MSLQCLRKAKGIRNLPQLSLELDISVDMSEGENLNLVQGPKTDQVPALQMFWYLMATASG